MNRNQNILQGKPKVYITEFESQIHHLKASEVSKFNGFIFFAVSTTNTYEGVLVSP